MKCSLILCAVFLLGACTTPKKSNDRLPAGEVGRRQAQTLYDALAVVEKDAAFDAAGNPTYGAGILEKSLGGLTCRQISIVGPYATTTFSCFIKTPVNARALYEGLNVVEREADTHDKQSTIFYGAHVLVKSIEDLRCTKSTVANPTAKPEYNCTFPL